MTSLSETYEHNALNNIKDSSCDDTAVSTSDKSNKTRSQSKAIKDVSKSNTNNTDVTSSDSQALAQDIDNTKSNSKVKRATRVSKKAQQQDLAASKAQDDLHKKSLKQTLCANNELDNDEIKQLDSKFESKDSVDLIESSSSCAKKVAKTKAKSKAKVNKNTYEHLLSFEAIENHANQALDFNAPILLVPIRHHSVAMALHLPRIIDAYQPDFIAVEMPYICQDQIKNLANSKVVPPIAFFSYGVTKTTQLVPVADNDQNSTMQPCQVDVPFRHIYPLLAYSPEYVAFNEAIKRNIDYKCIDLSACETEFLKSYSNSSENNNVLSKQEEHKNLALCEQEGNNDCSLSYAQALIKNSGDLSFEEFWDRNFEINALAQDTKTFLHNVYSYCYCIRKSQKDNLDITDIQRELYMLKQINEAKKNYKRILVLTGGLHSVALCDYLYNKKPKDKAVKFPKPKNNCFIIPYSFKSMDVQSDYQSGVVFPYYYHKLYQAINHSLSFNFDLRSLSGDEELGYEVQPFSAENFKYWDKPLKAINSIDKSLLPKNLNDKVKAKAKAVKRNIVTPSGYLKDVIETINSLGSINDQAKIKDVNEFNALVAKVSLAKSNQDEQEHQQVNLASDNKLLTNAQKEALLSFKANSEQLINAIDANNLFFTNNILDYRNHKMSTASKIDCQVMLKGLASLRDKFAPSIYELIDAVKSTFIKEEYNNTHYILVNLLKQLCAVPFGQVPLDVNVPPIWRDFVIKAKKFGLNTDGLLHTARVDIFKDEKNILKGRFFAQIAFLHKVMDDYITGSYYETNYINRTESYNYRYDDDVAMSIIEASKYGDTLEIACKGKLQELLAQKTFNLVQLCKLFKNSIDMGIENQYLTLRDLIINSVYQERDLSNIASSLDLLNSYTLIAKTTNDNKHITDNLIKLILNKALAVINDQSVINEYELDSYISSLMTLNYYFNKYDYITKQYYELLSQLCSDSSIDASLLGAYVSLLFKNKQLSYDEFEHFVDQFVYGSILQNNDCIGFFYSILKVSKASIFYRNGILQLLNAYIDSLQGEEFLKVLIMLRRSFALFSKEEIYKVAKLLQKIHGSLDISEKIEVSDKEFAYNRASDRNMIEKLSMWLPLDHVLPKLNDKQDK